MSDLELSGLNMLKFIPQNLVRDFMIAPISQLRTTKLREAPGTEFKYRQLDSGAHALNYNHLPEIERKE